MARCTRTVLCCALCAMCAGTTAVPSGATTATVRIAPGPLGIIVAPPDLGTPPVPVGLQGAPTPQSLEVTDATASGAEWALTIASVPSAAPTVAVPTAPQFVAVSTAAACNNAPSCDARDAGNYALGPPGGRAAATVRLARGRGSATISLTWTAARRHPSGASVGTVVISIVTGP